MLLSTCNRLEIYFHAAGECLSSCSKGILRVLCRYNNIISGPGPSFYAHKNKKAIEHLLKVAADLESMVVGENQILGQVKEA